MLLVASLYSYLWTKLESTSRSCTCIYLPDTIIFNDGIPQEWYFTSFKRGEILRKNRGNMMIRSIVRAMTQGCQSSDTSCTLAYLGSALDMSPTLCVTHLSAAQAEKFIPTISGSQFTGIVQRFVQPVSSKNSLLRVSWSPSCCTIEQRVSLHHVEARKHAAADRAATFFGPLARSRELPPTGTAFASRMAHAAKGIADHISRVLHARAPDRAKECNRLEVFLKTRGPKVPALVIATSTVLGEGRQLDQPLWDQWGKFVRFEADIDRLCPTIPVYRGTSESSTRQHKSPLVHAAGRAGAGFTCPRCGNMICEEGRPLPLKFMLQEALVIASVPYAALAGKGRAHSADMPAAFEALSVLSKQGGEEETGGKDAQDGMKLWESNRSDLRRVFPVSRSGVITPVPLVVQRAFPALSPSAFLRRCIDPTFCYQTVRVCEQCHDKVLSVLRSAPDTAAGRTLTHTAVVQHSEPVSQ
eukprot:gnl/Dysnectes_brevis/6178_a9370_237.p1 GENE.gnl/Dysnectes_brevis/6178_a9370_237~~gnl/Dysnectes_brevis/6178_a9370_237.p1  ORF type:complete len:471 (+),score=123.68 gnl/Dysnectes_brevis/6178_a9370_237:105-1517(+)